MKFFAPLALLSVVGVRTAIAASCDADFIVTRCLETEEPKAQECSASDYECLCAAYEAIATCYNNCPDDPRAAPAQNQVLQYCALVITSSSDVETATRSSVTRVTFTSSPTLNGEEEAAPSNTAVFSSGDSEDEEDAAGSLAARSVEVIFGLAAVVAAIL